MRIDEPTIIDFTLAQHSHTSPATGGPIGFPPQLAGLFLTVLEEHEIFEPPIIGVFSGNSNLIGPAGRDGRNGLDGLDASDGIDGFPGIQGIQGLQGIQGVPGIDGIDNAEWPEAPFVFKFPIVSASSSTSPGGSDKQVQFNDSSAFGGNSALTFDKATGTLALNGILDISGAAAGQIKFPATQVPSTDANILDDYEEGTWTPSDQSGAALTFAVAVGTYVKIGQFVVLQCDVTYPITASASIAKIGGFPFTTANVASVFWGGYCTFTDSVAATMSMNINDTKSSLYTTPPSTQKTNVQMSTFNVNFTIQYRATA